VRAQKEMIRGRLDADRKTSSRPIKERTLNLRKEKPKLLAKPEGSVCIWTGTAITYLIQRIISNTLVR
jgi:hypothetical protein